MVARVVWYKLAGIEGYASDGNNSLTQRLKEIEEKIKDLENKYEKEKDRYWKQFNTMEAGFGKLQ